MADKYLNESCTFRCSFAMGTNIFKAKEGKSSTARLQKKCLLTNSAMLLESPGILCLKRINPQGTPLYLPCILGTMGVTWKKCSRNVYKGRNLLTEKSRATCNVPGCGGELIVNTPVMHTCVQDTMGRRKLSPVIVSVKKTSTEGHPDKKEMDKEIPKEGSQNQTDDKKKQGEEQEHDKNMVMKCPYSSEKEVCRTCTYALARTDCVESAFIKENTKNPSEILRENYERDFKKVREKRDYLKRFPAYEDEQNLFRNGRAGNAAHHIISINDILMQPQVRFVLKLVNYYDWKVNDAFNCILLACNEERDDLKGLDANKARETKYQVMNAVRRQWHGGGHRYSDVDSDDYEGDYVTNVTQILMEVMNGLSSSYCRHADEKTYERGKAEFIDRMNKCVDYVCKRLADFEKDPKMSQPFYVSADAFRFAYGIPQSCRFLFVKYGKNRQELTVYKYIAFRNVGEGRILKFDCRGVKNFVLDSHDSGKKEERLLILFCEQIDVMILDKRGYDVEFPFSIHYVYEASVKNSEPQDYLNRNANAIGVFLSQVREDSQKENMRRHLSELRERG